MQTNEITPGAFLDAARRIARRLASTAEWEGEACTWTVMSPDRENPASRQAKPARAGGTVYEGASGIALFLAEAAIAFPDEPELARTAVGAIRYSLAEGEGLPESAFGLHAGRVGIAYAAARVAERLGHPELLAGAEALLRPLAGHESEDRGIDVIGGAGGAIPALLWLAHRVDRELATGIAVALGDASIASADRETNGWSWATIRSSSIRNLCGYAHGAAGMGHAFLELWHHTGDGKWRYAFEQAFLYERGFHSAEADNWPDLRHNELGEYQYQGRLEELRALLRAGGSVPKQESRYMSAWCHGAPGIGLTRLRAWELTGDPLYLAEAESAIRATKGSLGDPRMNYSLCHGQGGNAETLLEAKRLRGDDEAWQVAARAALAGIEAYEDAGRPWPCGTLGAVSDPGLLLGEAGIGLFLLRLADPSIPSALLVTPPPPAAPAPEDGAGWDAMQSRTLQEHFGRTLRLWGALGEDVAAVASLRRPGPAPLRSDVERVREAIEARIAAEADAARRERLAEAYAIDRARIELSRSIEDFTEEYTDAVARLPEGEVRWNESRLGLSSRARVVATELGLDDWAEGGGQGDPERADTFFLLIATANRVGVRRLSPFAAVILQALEQPAMLDEIVDRVEEAVSGGDRAPERAWLEEKVVEQLRQAYRAGFIVASPAVTAAAA